METSLHRKLKQLYAADSESTEVVESRFRIDALDQEGVLVEIQHSGLGAIRKKIKRLLDDGYYVRIVKPWIRTKVVATYNQPGGELIRRRKSPKQLRPVDFFRELIHFTTVFPHEQLTLELLLVDCVEKRVDTPRRGRRKQYTTIDIDLLEIPDPNKAIILSTTTDLWTLLGNPSLPKKFDTRQMADALGEPRWFAQQVAYVLKGCGATKPCAKRGNTIIYKAA